MASGSSDFATTLGETRRSVTDLAQADVMVNSGYLVGSAIFLSALIVLVRQICQEISSVPLLVGHRGINHCRHGCGRLCHPITGDRLYWRVTDPVRLSDDCACILVSIRGLHLGRYGEHTEGRSLLLGGDYIFPDVGNRPWRLDRRYRSWIWRRGAGLWRRTGGHCRSLLLDECVAGLAVLGRLHSNATTRCDVG